MQNIKLSLIAFVTLVAFVGCSDDVEYTPGESEDEDVAGVYFPVQTAFSDMNNIEITTTAPTEFEIRVRRTNSDEEIVAEMSVECAEADVFTVEDLCFAEGQSETTVKVSFPTAEIGVKYYCEVGVKDPKYTSIYNNRPITTDFSVTRVDWQKIVGPNGETMGRWRDDFFNIYTYNFFPEREVEIYERCDKPGYYRIENIYTGEFFAECVGMPGESYPSNRKDVFTTIDATDPTKVFIPLQELGFFVYATQGWYSFGSNTPENGLKGSLYGELKDGVITFPNTAIAGFYSNLGNEGYYNNISGMFRVVLPGVKTKDHSCSIKHEESKTGSIPLTFTLGEDVAKIEYAYFEGDLSETLLAAKSIDMDADVIVTEELTESTTLDVSLEKSGIYTVIANVYSAEGELVKFVSDSFGYIAEGDDKSVVLTLGAELTDRYTPEGYTRTNSINCWLYGEEVVEAYYSIYQTKYFNSLTKSEVIDDLTDYGAEFDEEQLGDINGNGHSFMVGDLYSGSDYTIALYAFNGYTHQLFTVEQTTEGTFSPLYDYYTDQNFTSTISKEELFKTWNLWATNHNDDENSNRQLMGKWSFSEAEDDEENYPGRDLITLNGIVPTGDSEEWNPEDATIWEYYDGYVYSHKPQAISSFLFEGKTYYQKFFIVDLASGEMFEDEEQVMIGGVVADGYMSFVTNTKAQSEFESDVVLIASYKDAEHTQNYGNKGLYYNIMLEDPAKSNADAVAKVSSLSSLMQASLNASNFVELRGAERIRAMIDEQRKAKVRKTIKTEIFEVKSVQPTSSNKTEAKARGLAAAKFSGKKIR